MLILALCALESAAAPVTSPLKMQSAACGVYLETDRAIHRSTRQRPCAQPEPSEDSQAGHDQRNKDYSGYESRQYQTRYYIENDEPLPIGLGSPADLELPILLHHPYRDHSKRRYQPYSDGYRHRQGHRRGHQNTRRGRD